MTESFQIFQISLAFLFLLYQIPIQDAIAISCSVPYSPLVYDNFRFSLFFCDLMISKRTVQVSCRTSLFQFEFVCYIFIIRMGLQIWGNNTTKRKCLSHCILSWVHNIDMTSLLLLTLITWLRWFLCLKSQYFCLSVFYWPCPPHLLC